MDKKVNNELKGVKGDVRITAYKVAAERYCLKMGENPEEQMSIPHPHIANVATLVPYWYTVAERMFDLAVLLRSMAEVDKESKAKAATAKDGGGDASTDA